MTLRVSNITVTFGGVTAVRDITIACEAATVTGLIGPNGAGKTTLFDVLSGFTEPDDGSVLLQGRDITRVSAARRARLGIGRTFQRLELFGSLTVFENLLVASEAEHSKRPVVSDLLRLPRRSRYEQRSSQVAREALTLLGLEDVADQRASVLPTGTARLVELARALCREPKLLLLDEPSSGLDPSETERVACCIERIQNERGCAVLLVEHDIELVMRVCSSIYVMELGSLVGHGPANEIANDPLVRSAYLGRDAHASRS